MVGGQKTIRVRPGHVREFEDLFAALREAMRRAEPGCLRYALLRSRADPLSYVVHELYRDDAALAAHEASPHGADYFPRIRGVLESIAVEYFDVVVE